MSSQPDKCPIILKSALFCRAILSEFNSDQLSIYGIIPALSYEITPNENAPDSVDIDAGPVAVYMLFERRDTKKLDPISVPIVADFRFPGFELIGNKLSIDVLSGYLVGQASFVVPRLTIQVPNQSGDFNYHGRFRAVFNNDNLVDQTIIIRTLIHERKENKYE